MAVCSSKLFLFGCAVVPAFLGIIWRIIQERSQSMETFVLECRNDCFYLPGMATPHSLLACSDINERLVIGEIIGKGAVKVVKRGRWSDKDLAVNTLASTKYRDDFTHGLQMLQQLQATVNVTRLVGVCKEQNIFVTQLHPLGSADRLEQILSRDLYHFFNTLPFRFSLCRQYVNILHSLHTLPEGPRVMCDCNDVKKTLSQFLLDDNLSLILNDVDALPLVDKTRAQLVKCGHHELFGEFVAPEQLWPFEDRDFSDTEMPGYDEMVDIWRVPDVCNAFLGDVEGSVKLRLQLLSVHLRCKNSDPSARPSALELLKAYEEIRANLRI